MPLLSGVAAPNFLAATHDRPDFAFKSLGGLFILMAFLPDRGAERDAADAVLRENARLFDDRTRAAFGVIRDAEDFSSCNPPKRGLRYFHDPDGEIAGLYRLRNADGSIMGQWVLLDPMMRIVSSWPLAASAKAFAQMREMNDVEMHAGVPMHAPVLIVPRVFEPAFCRKLIDFYAADGGRASGVMREVDGRTVGVASERKKRRDAHIEDRALREQIQLRIVSRLLPQIAKSLMFDATRIERYIVARYDAEDGGFFMSHRDNTTKGTAHRQFACSINLNAEEFEGGDLRFPEFGRRTYRPPTGGAVIFSCSLLHEATPVTKGTRYAFLPFFYNEAMAEVRKRNAGYLDVESLKPSETQDA